jgi:hypothetical protein
VTDDKYKAVRYLVDCVNGTGGVFITSDGFHAPVHAPAWIDMGAAYIVACRALGCDPIVTEMPNPRDHGLGDFPQTPTAAPTWTPDTTGEKCPVCESAVCDVTLKVESRLLRGGTGRTRYKGCPCCPWAGPALTVADAATH